MNGNPVQQAEVAGPMLIRKFAAIDVGSNAVRLLFTNVIEDGRAVFFNKASIIRVPVRLGDDVFENQTISEEMIQQFIDAIKGFVHLIRVYGVLGYRACGTSAMREALNGPEVVNRVARETGIRIEIITSRQEGDLIFENQISKVIDDKKTWMWVDLGGGSTEITVFHKRRKIEAASFNIGTVRLLKNKVNREEAEAMHEWLHEIGKNYPDLEIIGSGGNINRLFKMSEMKLGKPLSYYHLLELNDRLNSYSYEERVKLLGLNPDRADVIVLASQLFIDILEITRVKRILIPKVGLSDGIIHQLYRDFKAGKSLQSLS